MGLDFAIDKERHVAFMGPQKLIASMIAPMQLVRFQPQFHPIYIYIYIYIYKENEYLVR